MASFGQGLISFFRHGTKNVKKGKPPLPVASFLVVRLFLTGCASAEPVSSSTNGTNIQHFFNKRLKNRYFFYLCGMKSSLKYQKTCKWCRKPFIASRKDTVYCGQKCKSNAWHIIKDFNLVEPFLPEAEVEKRFRIPKDHACIIYFQWFRQGENRFADVYVSKNCEINGWEEKMRKKGMKITVQEVEKTVLEESETVIEEIKPKLKPIKLKKPSLKA